MDGPTKDITELTIDINGICNIACDFCYQELDGSELSQDEVLDFVRQSDAHMIGIGGGEPTLHPEFLGIVEAIRQEGRGVHIATNATTIPDGFLDLEETVRKGVQVQVSLHASNAELYDAITLPEGKRSKGLFNRVVENAKRLNDRYDTLISAVIYQQNAGDVEYIIDVAEQIGVPLIRITPAYPIGKGADVDLLDAQQLQDLRGTVAMQNYMQRNIRIESQLLHNNNCQAMENAYGIPKTSLCPADCSKLYVDPRGLAKSCEFLGE